MQRRKFVAASGLTLTAVLAGCGDTETSDENGENGGNGGNGENGENGDENGGNGDDGSNENGDDTEQSVDEPDDQEFSGSGATVEDVTIDGGLTVVEAIHDGSSNFQVSLVDDSEYDDIFINAIGAYDGATAELIDAGEYQMDVEADGDWSITVRQPRAASGDDLPQSLSGDSPDVIGPIDFSGSHVAEGSHSGESNFQVQIFPTEGSWGEVVFNEIGEYEGETTFNHDGVGYVDVEADGEWSLELE